MANRVVRVIVSSALGVALAAGFSYRLLRSEPVAAADAQAKACPGGLGIEPELEASFEAKYAGVSDDELAQWLGPLYENVLALTKAAAERRVAEGAFEEVPVVGDRTSLSAHGVSVASGLLTVSGPPGARVARNVIVPEGYDPELDVLRLEYSWLAARCGVTTEPGPQSEKTVAR